MKRIIIVEDEELIREELALMLEKAGYRVKRIYEFRGVAEQVFEAAPDLVILDLNLPNESGFRICQKIKKKSSLPILVLTSREQVKDEVQALKLGADEYLTKPFRKERLLARIKNLLKRYETRANLLAWDDFLLDRNTYTLYFQENSTVLPANQGKLLEAFLSAKTDLLSKEELSMFLWGTTEFIDENALQVNITRLRRVLKEIALPYRVVAVRGIGYKLVRERPVGAEDKNMAGNPSADNKEC